METEKKQKNKKSVKDSSPKTPKNLEAVVYNTEGKKSGTFSLPETIFGERWNTDLVHQVLGSILANKRAGTAHTKNRGEVRGGGKKPWKQKGTGRARAGSARSPLWRGGGITFGPTGEENYSKKLNIKAKRQAIRQALSMANTDGRISVIEAFALKDAKTKEAQQLLNKLGATRQTLVVVDSKDADLVRATNNLSEVKLVSAKYLNVFDVVNARQIVITQKALTVIGEWLGEAKPAATTTKAAEKKEAK